MKNWIIAIIAVLLAACICATPEIVRSAAENTNTSTMTLNIVFNKAAEKRGPNGEIFSIDSIKNGDVIEKALEITGLSSKYTVKDIQDNLIISGHYPLDIEEQLTAFDSKFDDASTRNYHADNYHATAYTITLRRANKELLMAIAEAYKDYFAEHYGYNFSIDSYERVFADNIERDYYQTLLIEELKLRGIKNYAEKMYDLEPQFMNDGVYFNDIITRINSLEEIRISRLRANISVTGLSKDKEKLKSYYQYEIRLFEFNKTELERNLKSIENIIHNFRRDASLYFSSQTGMIKIDGTSDSVYEKLVQERTAIQNKIASTNTDIARFNSFLDALDGTSDVCDLSMVESEISDIEKQIRIISDDFIRLLSAYNDIYVNREFIKVGDIRFTSVAKYVFKDTVKAMIKYGVLVCLILLAIKLIIDIALFNRETEQGKLKFIVSNLRKSIKN